MNGYKPPGTGGPMLPPIRFKQDYPRRSNPMPGFNGGTGGRSNPIPRFYQPPKGAPREYPAFMTPWEMQMLARLTDNTINMTPHGIPSFRLDDQDTKDMNTPNNNQQNDRDHQGGGGTTTGGNWNGGSSDRGPLGNNEEPRTNYAGNGTPGSSRNDSRGGNTGYTGGGPTSGPPSGTGGNGGNGNPNNSTTRGYTETAYGSTKTDPATVANVGATVGKVVQDVAKLGNTSGQVGAAPPEKIQDRILPGNVYSNWESFPMQSMINARPWNNTVTQSWAEINRPTTVDPVYDPQGAVPSQMQEQKLARDAWRGSIQDAQALDSMNRAMTTKPENFTIASSGYVGPQMSGAADLSNYAPTKYQDRLTPSDNYASTVPKFTAQNDAFRQPAIDRSNNYDPTMANFNAGSGYTPASFTPERVVSVEPYNDPAPRGGSVSPSQYSGPAQNMSELGNKFRNAYDNAKYGKENLGGRLWGAVSSGDFRNPGSVGSGGEANSGFKYPETPNGGQSKPNGSPGGVTGISTQPSFTDWYARNPWKYPEYTQTWAFTPFGQYWPS